MDNYKSWSELRKYLSDCLCDELREKITYFLTRYHKVHNSYGRAAICLDGKEEVIFSWAEMYRQEADISALYRKNPDSEYNELLSGLKNKWDESCTYCEMDFLSAVLEFRNLSIQDALCSENCIIRILAIMDKRVGKRTLQKIKYEKAYRTYPEWVRRFYELRLSCE